jgi:hypothetical protein
VPHLIQQIASGGPLLDILVGPSKPRADALRAANLPVPSAIQIRGLVDTGASCTCIDPAALQTLQLTPTGTIPIHTPSTGTQPHQTNLFDVLIHPRLSLTIQAVSVAESHLAIQGIQALIGRDVLRNCLLIYDGQAGAFTLAF